MKKPRSRKQRVATVRVLSSNELVRVEGALGKSGGMGVETLTYLVAPRPDAP